MLNVPNTLPYTVVQQSSAWIDNGWLLPTLATPFMGDTAAHLSLQDPRQQGAGMDGLAGMGLEGEAAANARLLRTSAEWVQVHAPHCAPFAALFKKGQSQLGVLDTETVRHEALLWDCVLEYVTTVKSTTLLMNAGGADGYTIVPHSLGRATHLRRLMLMKNKLTQLPPSLALMTALEKLQLSHNQLTALPEGVQSLTKLKVLGVGNNYITVLPAWLGRLTFLEHLSVRNNFLQTLPPSMRLLTRLSSFVAMNNQLTQPPMSSIALLPSLKLLQLGKNALASHHAREQNTEADREQGVEQVVELFFKSNMTLQFVDVGENQLTRVPMSPGCASTMVHFALQSNLLTQLPECIGKLKGLQYLDVSYNRLTSLPRSINDHAHKLRVLHAHHNQLLELPGGLGKLTALEQLTLFSNQLSRTPIFPVGSQLRFVLMHSNQIRHVDRGLQLLQNNNLLALTMEMNPSVCHISQINIAKTEHSHANLLCDWVSIHSVHS